MEGRREDNNGHANKNPVKCFVFSYCSFIYRNQIADNQPVILHDVSFQRVSTFASYFKTLCCLCLP